MDRQSQQVAPRGRPVTGKDVASALDYFEHFLNATSLKQILGYYRSICDLLNLKPNLFPLFYPKLRGHLTSWRAKALWKKFDARAGHKCYGKGKLCPNTRVLIIGAGPCGMRTAIEAQLLGAKVVVVEKRDRLSRNNVLHLWPFVIEDLRMLGAKKFFGKFCAGAIDHISIRQLQCILLKVALLLGVEVHTEVSFERLIEPNAAEKTGWKAEFKPANHPVSQFEFDVVIGADGKRNTLQGFKRKEFRGKLAIAITANFINKRTEAEARVEEISGVAFIFNQKFFKDLYEATGIDLENIVYYKDDTHYFVMTAKKHSLIDKGVIKQDLADTERLLAPDNVNREELMNYAREAANFSTNYQMPDVEFAVNHYGQSDVAMFDFTSMYAAENASKMVERNGYRLLMILVGDSLLEPFWPTGSGCARGFLSSLDAAWAIRSMNSGVMTPLDVLAERESIYRLLAQTTPDNLNKDWKAYTLDPYTRYPNLNKNVVSAHQTVALYDTDDPQSIEAFKQSAQEVAAQVQDMPKKRRRGNVDSDVLLNWISEQVRAHDDIEITDIASVFKGGKALCAILNHYRPDLLDYSSVKDSDQPAKNNQMAIDVLEKEIGISPIMTSEEITNTEDYLSMATYLTQVYDSFRCEIPHIKHPKLELPECRRSDTTLKSLKPTSSLVNMMHVQQAVPLNRPQSRHKRQHADVLVNKVGCSGDKKTRKRRTLERLSVSVEHDNKLTQSTRGNADEDFAARIKSLEDKWRDPQPVDKKPKDLMRAIGKIQNSDWNIKEIEKKIRENKLGKPANSKDKEKVPKWNKETFLARQTKMEKQHLDRQDSAEAKFADIDKNIKHLELKLKEGTARDLGHKKVATITEKLTSKVPAENPEPKPIQKSQSKPAVVLPAQGGSEFCHFCGKRVYLMERLSAEGRFFHHGCFKCQYCHTQLRLGSYAFDRDGLYGHKFFCIHHYGMQGELRPQRVARRQSQRRDTGKSPEKKHHGIAGLDLIDRVQTPERVEFSNLSVANASSDHEESLSQMDEDEWTDKNFGASTAELGSSDVDSSSLSDTDSDDEDAYEEALEEPATKEGTLKWAERFNKRYSKKRNESDSDEYSSSDSSYYEENSSDDDESDTATEGEEEIRARELRKQEVRVEPPVVQTDTGTDTEVVSDESSSESSSEIRNSATEISTDSEFAHDDPTPTREIPSIVFNDFNVTKTRGGTSNANARRIQVTTGFLQRPAAGGKNASPHVVAGGTAQRHHHTKTQSHLRKDVELKLSPLVPSAPSIVRKPALPLLRSEGYALNRTQSTGGIAAKVSLELKKKYLLGETNGPNSIQKSGSASTLDTKFKSFHTNISDCQKLLKKTPEPSPTAFKAISPLKEVEKPKEEEQEPDPPVVFENELEGRPRSPVHETSIIVPNIDWSKSKSKSQSEDSLSEDSGHGAEKITIPTVLIDEFPPDSLISIETTRAEDARSVTSTSTTEPLKSICSEKKTLNQPKMLPELHEPLPDVHETLHASMSGRSTPSNDSIAELATATVLTETELSDWARDGAVSDDLEDFEFCGNARNSKQPKVIESKPEHVCGKTIITEAMNSVLSKNLENIEFMDTGTETSSDDGGGLADSQNGYVLFKDEDEPADSLNPIVQAINPRNEQLVKNTGYCVIQQDNFIDNMKGSNNGFTDSTNNFVVPADNFGSEVIDLKPSDIEKIKSKVAQSEHDEDSLLIIDNNTGTTTEENTCSDSTVKNVTEISNEKLIENNNFQRKRLEDKLAKLKAEQAAKQQIEFDEHCHRLQSKVEFGNAKDSIDIRKSRRKSKSDSPRPDLIIQEEKEPRAMVENPIYKTPDVLYKKEIIEKERDLNQKLIQEMVMNKMKAENKSLERKKRSRPSPNATSPYDLRKSATSDIVSEINKNNLNISEATSNYATPDLVLSSLNKSDVEVFSTPATSMRPLSVFASFQEKSLIGGKENSSMPDVRKSLFKDEPSGFRKPSDDAFRTPVAPPRLKHEEAKRTAEKLKQDARVRARLLSNEELGLSPEDKIAKLKEKLSKRDERPNSWLVSNDTLNRKKNGSLRRKSAGNEEQLLRTKSIPEVAVAAAASTSAKANDERNICKSDPNLLDTNEKKLKPAKKSKDRERRKSITKMITNLFTKKSPTGQKGIFSRMSPKAKDLSKEVLAEEPPVRRKSFSEMTSSRVDNSSPPPVPPLPLNYTGSSIKGTDESSDGEHDWKRNDRSSCDTIDQSGILDSSLSSLSNRRASKGAQRVARQAQLKRLRMAQEIQRKLEEVEVKIRELEERGVVVEKALRVDDRSQDADLMREWFDLMRDRTELRRYEKELTVRAEELELEDRHARLQHELRKRLENNEQKTQKDIEVEGSIINEMMEIVAKRDSLIAVLEEDRLRYSNEDRDFEEQMLSKGLMLTSVRKTPEK